MEIKDWSYEDYPSFDEKVEGAVWIPTSGDEIGTNVYPNI